MDLSRRRHPDPPSDLARRRLEALGAQLGLPDEGPGEDRPPPDAPRTSVLPPVDARGPVLVGRHRHVDPPGASLAPRDRLHLARQALVGDRPVRVQHVVVALVVVLLALGLTAWWVDASRPGEVRPVGASTGAPDDADAADVLGSAPTDAPAPDPASTGATASGQVVVDVTGKVRRPGIVTLPAGSRVADALEAAGGAPGGTDLSSVNLARVLADGEQVVVGLPAVAAAPAPSGSPTDGTAGSGAAPAGKVNLNTATLEQLDTLPGVGPVTAQAILDHRASIGRFTSVDELLEVRGIGDARMADLRDLVGV
ncbi:helix-hairpin-helix domain-containing protein [Solicola sp. PLA-1-18]|uniref:helix-hairpin-helix domain-containing protein n=1 Tax=Solicola sp. PLA-1-18 TaxID=3380532 RepID=UPI003B8239E0